MSLFSPPFRPRLYCLSSPFSPSLCRPSTPIPTITRTHACKLNWMELSRVPLCATPRDKPEHNAVCTWVPRQTQPHICVPCFLLIREPSTNHCNARSDDDIYWSTFCRSFYGLEVPSWANLLINNIKIDCQNAQSSDSRKCTPRRTSRREEDSLTRLKLSPFCSIICWGVSRLAALRIIQPIPIAFWDMFQFGWCRILITNSYNHKIY